MNFRLKNSLIIVATLLLGIIIGFLVSGRFTKIRLDNMKQNFTDQGMNRHMMKVLQLNPEQLNEINPIFDKYAEIRRDQLFEHHKVQQKIFEDFEEELRPYLSQNQMERLQRMKESSRNKFPGFNNDRNRPGRGQGRQYQRRGNNYN